MEANAKRTIVELASRLLYENRVKKASSQIL